METYHKNGYEISKSSFRYKGELRSINEILELNIVENSIKKKITNGLIGSLISSCLYFFIVPAMGDHAEWNTVIVFYIIPLIMTFPVFIICYIKTKKYSLELKNINGTKGIIDSSNDKHFFLELVDKFNSMKKIESNHDIP